MSMIVLGLDPGIGRCGFGVIDTKANEQFVRCGCLVTPTSLPLEDRLLMLGQDLEQLISAVKPDLAVVEQIFFGKNHKTAMLIASARGVLLYVLRTQHIPIEARTPLQIKSQLTGYGAASKAQVQSAVQRQLGLTTIPQPDDAADALAAALCIVR